MFLTPRGRRFTQADAQRYAAGPGLILLCGRYEGVDQRVIDAHAMEEVSIGDYVLSGGELARAGGARRRRPPAARRDGRRRQRHRGKFFLRICWNTRTTPAPPSGRAAACRTCCCPATMQAVAAWRRAEAERITRERRPDLWAAYRASDHAAPVASPATAP